MITKRLGRAAAATAWILGCVVSAPAQVSTYALVIGGPGAAGCFDTVVPPRLSSGSVASGVVEFRYDAESQILRVVVHNTSPVVPGEPHPLITQVAWNLAWGSVTGAELLSQSTPSGVAPQFALEVDPEPGARGDIRMGCFGTFEMRVSRNAPGGIADPAATTFAVPSGVVPGPVTFDIRLRGPGVRLLSAQLIGEGLSRPAPFPPLDVGYQVNAACFFDGGGPGGTGSGFISSSQDPTECQPNVWITNPAVIGRRTRFCLQAAAGCQGCFIGSQVARLWKFGPVKIPVGPPFLFEVPLPPLVVGGQRCYPVDVPNMPSLVGTTIYLSLVTALPSSQLMTTGANGGRGGKGGKGGGGPATEIFVHVAPRFNVTILASKDRGRGDRDSR